MLVSHVIIFLLRKPIGEKKRIPSATSGHFHGFSSDVIFVLRLQLVKVSDSCNYGDTCEPIQKAFLKYTIVRFSLVPRAELFKGWLALNPGLKLTRVSLSCVQKHFLG